MENVKVLLGAAACLTERNVEAIDQLTERIDRQGANIDRLEMKLEDLSDRVDLLVTSTQSAIEGLVASQAQAQANLDQLAALMIQFIQDAEADRTVVRGIQTENQRILEYLFGQQEP